MRVFLGMIDIANQIGISAKYLNDAGVYTRFCFENPHLIGLHQHLCKDWAEYQKYRVGLPGNIKDYDIYDFFFGTSHRLTDLITERRKIIYHFCGSEVRQLSISKKTNPYAAVKEPDEDRIKKNLDRLAVASKVCTIRDYELYDHLVNHFEKIHIVPRMVEPSKYYLHDKSIDRKPIFAHAPSDTRIKGTDIVNNVIKKFPVDYQLIYKMSHKRAMDLIDRADVVIDQLKIGTYGVLSIEAMMRGKVVICYVSDYMKKKLPKELPIIYATPDDLEEVIKKVLDRRDDWRVVGEKSIEYAMKYHSPKSVTKQLIDVYESL